ncbi:MAG: FAD-dependent monooxygenase [Myxococcota bacterium]
MIHRIDKTSPDRDTTAVLIIGGSLVGLSAACFLAWRGVPTLLVERHLGSAAHPRAIGFTARTLELYRAIGLGERIPQVPPDARLRRARVESLAGAWHGETAWTQPDAAPRGESSPCTGAAIAQDRLEPILRERARELGADLRLGSELLAFEQDESGVTARLRDHEGRDYSVRAAYLIAADGHRSAIRDTLGIGRSGRGFMRAARSVIFRAPIGEYLERGVSQFQIEQPDLSAFLTTYGDGRWLLILPDDVERDDAALRALIRKAIGRSDLGDGDIELVTTGRWEVSALIADRFAAGRVFLAGDAAHTLPPNRGGFGANTGIEDVHNLAWKLAAVLDGRSRPALLDSYDAERRPIAWLRHQQIFAREDFRAMAAGTAEGAPIYPDDALELGQLLRSDAILGAGPELAPARRPDEWAGQPGTRAPHARLPDGRSTLDLFQRGWVVVADDDAWRAPAPDVACLRVGRDLPESYRAALGLEPGGASLIRPDGYVAWRSIERPADPAAALADALRRAACA